MINPHDNYWIPSEGYKYLTNGDIYTDSIYLGNGANIADWHDTNDEPEEDVDDAEALEILLGGTV